MKCITLIIAILVIMGTIVFLKYRFDILRKKITLKINDTEKKELRKDLKEITIGEIDRFFSKFNIFLGIQIAAIIAFLTNYHDIQESGCIKGALIVLLLFSIGGFIITSSSFYVLRCYYYALANDYQYPLYSGTSNILSRLPFGTPVLGGYVCIITSSTPIIFWLWLLLTVKPE